MVRQSEMLSVRNAGVQCLAVSLLEGPPGAPDYDFRRYDYTVVTWRSSEKAVAIAVLHHTRVHPETASRVCDVAVKILPVPRDDAGKLAIPPDALVDRWEW